MRDKTFPTGLLYFLNETSLDVIATDQSCVCFCIRHFVLPVTQWEQIFCVNIFDKCNSVLGTINVVVFWEKYFAQVFYGLFSISNNWQLHLYIIHSYHYDFLNVSFINTFHVEI